MRSTALLAAALAVSACAPPAPPGPPSAPGAPAPDGPFGIILFIADGAGIAHWTAAKLQSSQLAVQRLPVAGLVDTRASNSRVTDSAAGATAFSAGVRTFNGAIGVDEDTVPVRTVLQVAEARRMSTGLVATSTLTHATPASFAAHVPSRNMHFEIAAHMARQGIEVLLGGGKKYFDPRVRPDGEDLLRVIRRDAAYVETAEAFHELDADTVSALVGFFHEDNPGPAIARQPNLSELTRTALRVLERNDRGFFLMVEGSQIDWRAHENAPLQDVIAEMADFDMAIGAGIEFAERRPNTLVVVVSDHETGGLALHTDRAGVFRAHYTTEGHSGEMVPLFAMGPGAESFAGVRENYEVGRLLLEMLGESGPRQLRVRTTTGSTAPWTPSSDSPRP